VRKPCEGADLRRGGGVAWSRALWYSGMWWGGRDETRGFLHFGSIGPGVGARGAGAGRLRGARWRGVAGGAVAGGQWPGRSRGDRRGRPARAPDGGRHPRAGWAWVAGSTADGAPPGGSAQARGAAHAGGTGLCQARPAGSGLGALWWRCGVTT